MAKKKERDPIDLIEALERRDKQVAAVLEQAHALPTSRLRWHEEWEEDERRLKAEFPDKDLNEVLQIMTRREKQLVDIIHQAGGHTWDSDEENIMD
jgi:hypothetical protein